MIVTTIVWILISVALTAVFCAPIIATRPRKNESILFEYQRKLTYLQSEKKELQGMFSECKIGNQFLLERNNEAEDKIACLENERDKLKSMNKDNVQTINRLITEKRTYVINGKKYQRYLNDPAFGMLNDLPVILLRPVENENETKETERDPE